MGQQIIYVIQQAVNAAVPALITVLSGFLVVIIKGVGDVVISFFTEKAKAVKAKAGQEKWDFWTGLARQAWNITEEDTRVIPTLEKTFAAKQAQFAVQIRKMIPEITDEQIEVLRQAIAGEVNKGKANIVAQFADSGETDIPAGAASGIGAVAPITSGVE
jgi:Na+-transporting methylmalonyl-CoA/oxaloacetate decarboxylase gamma subunit